MLLLCYCLDRACAKDVNSNAFIDFVPMSPAINFLDTLALFYSLQKIMTFFLCGFDKLFIAVAYKIRIKVAERIQKVIYIRLLNPLNLIERSEKSDVV